MTGTGVHLFKIPNAAFCLPSSVTLQSTKESTCVWKLGWNTLSFLFYINVKSRKIELSSIFYQKRRARSFPRSEIFSEGRVDATRVLIFSSALRKFTYAISSHIRLNTLLSTVPCRSEVIRKNQVINVSVCISLGSIFLLLKKLRIKFFSSREHKSCQQTQTLLKDRIGSFLNLKASLTCPRFCEPWVDDF